MRLAADGRVLAVAEGKIERLNRTIEQELLQGLPGWTGGHRDVRRRLVDQTPWTLERFVVVFADWVSAYITRRPHTALAGRTQLELWRSDPTPVRALEHEQARWMLLARKAHVVQKDGIHHDRDIYFADELAGMVGEEVEVAHRVSAPPARSSPDAVLAAVGRW